MLPADKKSDFLYFKVHVSSRCSLISASLCLSFLPLLFIRTKTAETDDKDKFSSSEPAAVNSAAALFPLMTQLQKICRPLPMQLRPVSQWVLPCFLSVRVPAPHSSPSALTKVVNRFFCALMWSSYTRSSYWFWLIFFSFFGVFFCCFFFLLMWLVQEQPLCGNNLVHWQQRNMEKQNWQVYGEEKIKLHRHLHALSHTPVQA